MLYYDVGILFIWISIGMIVVAPFTPKIILQYKPNLVQYSASWFFVIVRMSYILLAFVPEEFLKVTGCAIFFLVGIAACLSETASTAWALMSVGKEDRHKAMAVMVSLRSSASILGPLVGGLLYEFGGYPLPFIISGIAFASYLVWKRHDILENGPPENILESSEAGIILKHTPVLLCTWIQVMTLTQFMSGQSWWQPFMKDVYGFKPIVYGIMISFMGFSFIVPAAYAGTLTGTIGPKSTMAVGLLLWLFGFLFVGPSPLVSFLPQPDPSGSFTLSAAWVPVLGLVLILAGYAFLIVVISPMATNYAMDAGWALDEASAQNSMFMILGVGIALGVGPFGGAMMVQHFGVPVACTIIGLSPLVHIGLPLGLLAYWESTRTIHASSRIDPGYKEALLH
jgi:MFS family permease